MFCKKGVLKNFVKFTGKQLRQSLFFDKVVRAESKWLKNITVKTVHRPLNNWLLNTKEPVGKLVGRKVLLQTHHFDVQYRLGKANGSAEAISRGKCYMLMQQEFKFEDGLMLVTIEEKVKTAEVAEYTPKTQIRCFILVT